MVSVKKSIRSDEVNLQGQHILFIEGKDENSVDPKALKQLFDNQIRVETLGASFSVKSVAEALYPHHPTYYFLIDRDHQDDVFVQRCWENFPDPNTHNLLVWRRREIENYFLEPSYLSTSRYCKVNKEKLAEKILNFSKDRLFLDVANYVVITIREELKQNWIQKFSKLEDFSSKESALNKLKTANEFEEYPLKVSQKISEDEIEKRFNDCLALMTGGQEDISFNKGSWLSMIQGKKVLLQIINSECFQVKTPNGISLSGKQKLNAIVTELLRKDEDVLPADFKELKQLIQARVTKVNF
jgi:hypothetical protein